MPILTSEQKKASDERARMIYGPNLERLKELNNDNSVRTFWSSRSDELNRKMYEIDCDQARSLAKSISKWFI